MNQNEINEAAEIVGNIQTLSFFNKLAEYGYQPRTDAEYQELFNLGSAVGEKVAANLQAQGTEAGEQAKVASYQLGTYSEYEGPSADVIQLAQNIFSEPVAKVACCKYALAIALQQ